MTTIEGGCYQLANGKFVDAKGAPVPQEKVDLFLKMTAEANAKRAAEVDFMHRQKFAGMPMGVIVPSGERVELAPPKAEVKKEELVAPPVVEETVETEQEDEPAPSLPPSGRRKRVR